MASDDQASREFRKKLREDGLQVLERLRRRPEELESLMLRTHSVAVFDGIAFPPIIKRVASQYVQHLIRTFPRQGIEESTASSSCDYPFLSVMAQLIGKSMDDTAQICNRLLSDGKKAIQHDVFGIGALQSLDKISLLIKVHYCRTFFEKYPNWATKLPDQEALLVQANILDEFL
ncbi:unnamed protein product [Calypogeia fissa]